MCYLCGLTVCTKNEIAGGLVIPGFTVTFTRKASTEQAFWPSSGRHHPPSDGVGSVKKKKLSLIITIMTISTVGECAE